MTSAPSRPPSRWRRRQPGRPLLSVGSDDAVEQIRDAVAVGCTNAILIEADTSSWGPVDVAAAIATLVREQEAAETSYDLILVGNDAADTGDFQVGVRLGYALGRPVLTGIATVDIADGTLTARGDGPDGTEVFSLPLPAVVAIQEGGISPRYPSIPGRMKAKRTVIETRSANLGPVGSGRVRLKLPPAQPSEVTILGTGPEAAPALVDLLVSVGVVAP